MDVLDKKSGVGNWLIEETKELAALGLNCAEPWCKDRPDLHNQVLPVLLRLKEVTDKAKDSAPKVKMPPSPNQFISPTLKVSLHNLLEKHFYSIFLVQFHLETWKIMSFSLAAGSDEQSLSCGRWILLWLSMAWREW